MGACWILHRTAEGRHFHFSSVQAAAKSTGNKAERLRHPWAYECLWASYKAGSCMTCWLVSLCLSRLYVNNNHQSKTKRERVNKTAPWTLTHAYTNKPLPDEEVKASSCVQTLSDNTEAFVMTTAEQGHRRPHWTCNDGAACCSDGCLCRRVHVQKCDFYWFLWFSIVVDACPFCPRL